MVRTSFLVLLVSLVVGWATPLAPRHPPCATKSTTMTRLHMAPKFDGEKWVAGSDEELPSAGYGIGKTLLLQGPRPFLTRVFQPDDYEQAVLKFMASDRCDRVTAQGNMDAYLRNPQDWQFSRMEAERKGITIDYTRLRPKEIVLVLAWSGIVTAVVLRLLYSVLFSGDFYDFGPFAGSV